jgi:DNA adenine methylase
MRQQIGGERMKFNSPLRYPGGKAGLTGFLTDVIDLNDLRGCVYYEPYAGGAGAALSLLTHNVVSEIHINDADKRVYAFWVAALNYSERFAERIRTVPLSIEEWNRQKDICTHPNTHSRFDVGFAAFFMNRCNRSGLLMGSGPIGGYEQAGKWRLDARFNRDSLSERILVLGRYRQNIQLSCEDAIIFLKSTLPRGHARKHAFVYLDPPYVTNGHRLYLNAYKANDHAHLARYLSKQAFLPWIMSYDDSDLIRELYSLHKIAIMPIRYTFQNKRAAQELIISPQHLAVPLACRIYGRESRLKADKIQRRSL